MKIRAALGLLGCTLTVCAATALTAPAVEAATPFTLCPGITTTPDVKVAQLDGWTESIAVDPHGRMFTTQLYADQVVRIDHPGATPTVLTTAIPLPGGIAVLPDGMLLVGSLNVGPLPVDARLYLVDPETGATSVYASGLNGIDGVAVAPDGTVYVSTAFGDTIGRVSPTGRVTRAWSTRVLSPNGIAIAPDGSGLLVIQSLPGAKLYRIPFSNPATAQVVASTSGLQGLSGPDGLTLDPLHRPVISTDIPGGEWRQDGTGFCAIQANALPSPQAVYGVGSQGFSAGNLYRSDIAGGIYEVPSGHVG